MQRTFDVEAESDVTVNHNWVWNAREGWICQTPNTEIEAVTLSELESQKKQHNSYPSQKEQKALTGQITLVIIAESQHVQDVVVGEARML